MTNTLHRLGDSESFRDDFIVFAIPSKSNKDPNALPKLHRFMEIAMEYKPVNLGETRHGGALRPSKNLSPLSHWKRDMKPDFQAVIKGLTIPTTCAAVFDNLPRRGAVRQAHQRRGPGDEHQHFDLHRGRGELLQLRLSSTGTAWATPWALKGRRKRSPTRKWQHSRPCAGME